VTALRVRWALLLLAAVVGTGICAQVFAEGARAGWSFLGGLAMVVLAFEFGSYNIRFATRYLPNLTLVVALFSYTMTVVALAVVLTASSPRVVVGTAVATGLFVGIALWIGTEIAHTRVRSDRP
jgi:hypothetical protein